MAGPEWNVRLIEFRTEGRAAGALVVTLGL